MNELQAISPIDGRYRSKIKSLAPFFSEQAFMRYRLMAEGEYLIALADSRLTRLRRLTEKEKKLIRSTYAFSLGDARITKAIETKGYKVIPATNHDTKSVEYFLKDRLAKTSLKDVLEWIHFGLTSEDVINLAYALMLSDALEAEITPAIEGIKETISGLAKKHRRLPMLARTHGQPASPTTFGKEMQVFVARLARRLAGLQSIRIQAKLNGATGNWNAHVAAYPKADWRKFSTKFIESFNKKRKYRLEANLLTTQIEPHDSYVAVFDALRRINTIFLDFSQDMWLYISDEWLVQMPVKGEVGSSTMPHKINPWKFENAEGNLGLANTLFEFFARKLPISRLQRDLSDSTVQRSFGSALGYCLIGYDALKDGLRRVSVNEPRVRQDLQSHPEVIAEAIQTILRREGVEMPYEKLKELTRGRKVTMEDLAEFIDGLSVSLAVKKELKRITPLNYVGLADKF